MDDVGTRLDKAAKLGGYKSRRKMAEALGIPYSTLNKWVNKNAISEKGAVQISSKIPISQTYLLTGEGEAEVIQSNFNRGIQGIGNISGSSDVRVSGVGSGDEGVEGAEKDVIAQKICEEALKLDENTKKKVLYYIWKLQGIIDE